MDIKGVGDERTAAMRRYHTPAGSPEAKAKLDKRRANWDALRAAGEPIPFYTKLNARTAARRQAKSAALEAALVPAATTAQWSPEKQVAFLTALGETGRVDMAVGAAGMKFSSLYALRRRDQEFAAAWADALACHAELAEAIVLHKAVHGYDRAEDEPGNKRVFSERLMVEVLRTRRARAVAQVEAKADADAGKAGEAARLKFEAVLRAIADRIAEAM